MSSNTYVRIGREDFENSLTALAATRVHQSTLGNTKELVYDVPSKREDLTVRVFSSLTLDGQARDVGADAIRAVVWSQTADAPLAGTTHTKRIASWRANLMPKIAGLLARIAEGEFDHTCPRCDGHLAARTGKNGDFVGCAAFPRCKFTADSFEDVAATAAADEAEVDANADLFDSLPAATGAKGEVIVGGPEAGEYRPVVTFDTSNAFDAKDAIKATEWAETHYKFDGARKLWTADAEAFATVANAVEAAGFTLVRADPDAFDFDVWMDEERPGAGHQITVTYTKKNGNGTSEKSGEVLGLTGDMNGVVFRRDDDQRMIARADGLFTTHSHAPFVGKVVSATLDRSY